MTENEFKQLEENLAHHSRMITHLQKKYRGETGREFCTAGIGRLELPECCQGCDVYTPATAPELAVYYKTGDEVEVCDILVHGQEVSERVYDLLNDRTWETEIETILKKRAQDIKDDKAVQDWEIRQIEGRK